MDIPGGAALGEARAHAQGAAGERLRAMGADAERTAEERHGQCFARFGEDAAFRQERDVVFQLFRGHRRGKSGGGENRETHDQHQGHECEEMRFEAHDFRREITCDYL